jgi:hypothetical protein
MPKQQPPPDLSEFDALMGGQQGGGARCKTGLFLREIGTPEQVEKLRIALSRSDISNVVITKVLNSWGYKVSQGPVGNHRRGECMCPK